MVRGARVHSAGKPSVVNTKNTQTSTLVTSGYHFAYLMVDSCATAWLITLIEVIWCNRTDRNRVWVGVGTVLQNIVFMPWDIKADACGMEKLCARLLRNTSIGTCTLNSNVFLITQSVMRNTLQTDALLHSHNTKYSYSNCLCHFAPAYHTKRRNNNQTRQHAQCIFSCTFHICNPELYQHYMCINTVPVVLHRSTSSSIVQYLDFVLIWYQEADGIAACETPGMPLHLCKDHF